jgi:hypothetical protein
MIGRGYPMLRLVSLCNISTEIELKEKPILKAACLVIEEY